MKLYKLEIRSNNGAYVTNQYARNSSHITLVEILEGKRKTLVLDSVPGGEMSEQSRVGKISTPPALA